MFKKLVLLFALLVLNVSAVKQVQADSQTTQDSIGFVGKYEPEHTDVKPAVQGRLPNMGEKDNNFYLMIVTLLVLILILIKLKSNKASNEHILDSKK